MKSVVIKKPVTRGVAKVPVIMQMEALECGAASLTMVLAYYDKWVPLEQVRSDCGVSRDGSNAKNILMAARSYGLTAKAYRLEPEDLKEHGSFPCIIHWNFNHFVVLDGFKGDKAILNDPARGVVPVSMEVFDESFTGICMMFEPGEDFEEYLKEYHHGTMILNIKSERIEHKVLELVGKYDVPGYFFLDSSFPMIKLLTDRGERNIALRFSELEGLDTIRNMAGKADWVWVDCFTRLPIDKESYRELKRLGYKLCVVSPELEGQPEKIEEYRDFLERKGIVMDAVCTKEYNIKKWQRRSSGEGYAV